MKTCINCHNYCENNPFFCLNCYEREKAKNLLAEMAEAASWVNYLCDGRLKKFVIEEGTFKHLRSDDLKDLRYKLK